MPSLLILESKVERDCFVSAVDQRFIENPRAEFDSLSVVKIKAVFEMGASSFTRI